MAIDPTDVDVIEAFCGQIDDDESEKVEEWIGRYGHALYAALQLAMRRAGDFAFTAATYRSGSVSTGHQANFGPAASAVSAIVVSATVTVSPPRSFRAATRP